MSRKYIDMDKAIQLYRDQQIQAEEVCKMVGCSAATLISRLREYGIEIRKNGYWNKKVDIEDIKKDYFENNMSLTEISKKYSIGTGSLCERFKKAGIKLRDQKKALFDALSKLSLEQHKEICDLYLNDKTQSCSKIAKLYNVNKTTIASILKKNGVKLESSGPRNGSWKGGITPLYTKIRNCEKADFWRRACMERDEYKCKITNETGRLQVHHYPKTFSEIYAEFLNLNKHLDPIENYDELFNLSQNYEPFWDINNGLTLSESAHKRLHTKKEISNEEILSLHDRGWSCEKISLYFGKSTAFARERLKKLGIELRNIGFYNKQRNEITEEIEKGILDSYINNETTRNICKKFSVGNDTLYKVLEKNDIKPGNRKYDQRSDATKQAERVIQLYSSGVTIQEIAKIYNVADTTIRNILNK